MKRASHHPKPQPLSNPMPSTRFGLECTFDGDRESFPRIEILGPDTYGQLWSPQAWKVGRSQGCLVLVESPIFLNHQAMKLPAICASRIRPKMLQLKPIDKGG